jgi:hypothetical protein
VLDAPGTLCHGGAHGDAMTNELLPSTAQVLPEGQRGPRPVRRFAASAGVIGLVVVGVIVIVALVGDRNRADESARFVLPEGVADWQVSEGTIAEAVSDANVAATDQRFIAEGSLYGVQDGDGFSGLRSAVRYPESPLPGARWEPADTVRGDAYRRVGDSMTFAVESPSLVGVAPAEFGDGWLVASAPSDLVHAYGMLSNDTIGLVLLAAFTPTPAPGTPTTSFVMTSPVGSTFTVETAPGSPLFDVSTFADRIEPVDIDGIAGWIVEDRRSDRALITVTWSPEPGHTVSVRSTASADEVVDAARQLRPVAADEWRAAMGG